MKAIPTAAKAYEAQLREEVNQDREDHGKKPFDDNPPDAPVIEKEITVSTTDPDCGLFHKGEHKKCFAYKSDPKICEHCPMRHLCTSSRSCQKVVTQHIWRGYIEQAEDIRHSPPGKQPYEQRKETIERVFANAKEKHGMRYTPHRGLTAVTKWVTLKFAVMNLKKYAIHKWKDGLLPSLERVFLDLFRVLQVKNPVFVC